MIYDSRRKQVLAARDPSGSVPLYIAFGDEGSVSFTSSLAAVPLCADGAEEVGNLRSSAKELCKVVAFSTTSPGAKQETMLTTEKQVFHVKF